MKETQKLFVGKVNTKEMRGHYIVLCVLFILIFISDIMIHNDYDKFNKNKEDIFKTIYDNESLLINRSEIMPSCIVGEKTK